MLDRLSSTSLNPSQLSALAVAIQRFPNRIRERGEAYAAQGRAAVENVANGSFGGPVRGTKPYLTWWDHGQQGWQSTCSCPLGGECKHAYALACVFLGEARHAVRSSDARPTAAVGTAPPALRSVAPARAPRGDDTALERLRRARVEWERQSALDELLANAPVLGLNPYTPPLSHALQEPDPDLLCWDLARTIAGLAQGWLPEPLEPFRQRSDLADRYADRERSALADDLLGWTYGRAGDAKRQLRVVFDLVPNGSGDATLVFEVRVSTPRLADVPRTAQQIQQLRSELLRSPGVFPPAQAEVLEWLADHAFPAPAAGSRAAISLQALAPVSLLERVADSPLATWAPEMAPELATRGGITAGATVRLHGRGARLVPECDTRDGGLHVALRVLWPDGTSRPLDEVVLIPNPAAMGRRASLVVAGGAISVLVEEPPAPLRERFRSVGSLPIAPPERGAFVAALATRFPHLRATLRAHTRVHRATPSIALDLRPDDWLHVRLFAQSGPTAWQPGHEPGDGGALFEHTFERGWARCTASATAVEPIEPAALPSAPVPDAGGAPGGDSGSTASDEELWIEAPAPESVAPALTWLERLPLSPASRVNGSPGPADGERAGWWMRATRRNMELLADAWESRPPEVTFFGSESVRRLLGPGRAVVPHLRVAGSGVDWLSISAEWEAEGRRLSAADLAKLRAATTRFVRLESGWVAADAGVEQEALALALADLGIEAGGGEQRLSMWQLAGASPATLHTLERIGGDRDTLATLARLREQIDAFAGVPSIPLPVGLTAELRGYQRLGLDFLAHAATLGLGAVLADDMGLGKTVQALAWLLHLREREPGVGPALVVCPASVVHNWAREAERFAPGLRVLLLTSGKTRHALREEIPEHDLVVTTYALLRRDLDAWRTVALHAAILDEAQFIKNPDAAVTRAARALEARHRLALTGTPLENRALDLWSILSFTTPGYLGPRGDFNARFDCADAPPHARALLGAKLRPLLLRRSKQAVAPELPPRIEERRDCELSKEQRQLYVAELQRSRALLTKVEGMPGGVPQNKISILAALTRLRQICCHPALADGRAGLSSGKFDAFFELLEPLLAEGHKVLVFSQFVRCLKLLATELRERGIAFHTLTGQTVKRERVVNAFQDDPRPCIFLISLKAGGTGLNLTSASYVVLFDPWWNPAVEAQAIDRTHRIGQDRTVIAYRMLTLGTIEEKIWELQQRKSDLAKEVLGEGGFARALSRDDLEYLFADVS
jgi:superfamily II DNA or RNA helicase